MLMPEWTLTLRGTTVHGLEIDPAFSLEEVIQATKGGCLDTLAACVGDLQEVR